MLGYKHFLWGQAFVFAIAVLFIMLFPMLTTSIIRPALLDHPDTGMFYHLLVCFLAFWNLQLLPWKWATRIRESYNAKYELEVNNFFYHFTPMLSEKLKRHNDFKDFNDLLKLAAGIHKDAKELHVLIREVKPHVS